jgi:hypothetical protein
LFITFIAAASSVILKTADASARTSGFVGSTNYQF